MSAEIMTNWMPRVLGSMMLRPGFQYLEASKSNNQARQIPFIYGADDYAQLEFTNAVLRVWISDSLLSRASVTAAITNGAFTSDVTGWTDSDESGAASTWLTGGYLQLLGTGTNAAIREQEVTVNEASTEHALRIVIQRGPVMLRVGSSSGDDDYIAETALGTGEHSLTFTPSANFHVYLFSRESYPVLVDSVAVESSGTVEITSPYATADLRSLRYAQSGDVVYLACDGYQQYKIERRSTNSWSLVKYEPKTGPFRTINTTNVTIASNGLEGAVTLTASKPLFKSTHVGALFRHNSVGQNVSESVTAEDTFTDPIRVAGVDAARVFGITITGSFTATITVQYSIGEPGTWIDLATTYSAPVSTSYDDGLDNQVIYYRIGVKSGDFGTGTANVYLTYASGSIAGIARITGFTNSTSVSAVVLKAFGAGTASSDWSEGKWSDLRGYPTAVALWQGRLWWGGRDDIDGSISDAYEDFDDTFEGDAGPINRTIGEGPVDAIHWMMSLGRLGLGTALNSANVQPGKISGNIVKSIRSSGFDEPVTPTDFQIKSDAERGVYVDTSGQRVYELAYSIQVNDYVPEELTLFAPDINSAGIVHIAVQMKPDVRIHCVRSDGTVGVLVFDRLENVICWCEVETDGSVEDVCVLPGDAEDSVYYWINRTIDGSTVRYLEKWALESECVGGDLNKQADSFVVYDGSATTTPFTTELLHLAGETVVIWADGVNVGTDTVTAGGALTSALASAASKVVVGLAYTAQFKSAKQAIATQIGALLGSKGTIPRIGLLLENTHHEGLEFGMDFDNLSSLPTEVDGAAVADDTVHSTLDLESIPIDSTHTTDPRICLQATAPKPCTVLAATYPMRRGLHA